MEVKREKKKKSELWFSLQEKEGNYSLKIIATVFFPAPGGAFWCPKSTRDFINTVLPHVYEEPNFISRCVSKVIIKLPHHLYCNSFIVHK